MQSKTFISALLILALALINVVSAAASELSSPDFGADPSARFDSPGSDGLYGLSPDGDDPGDVDLDDEAQAEGSQQGCHPVAQRIADSLNSLNLEQVAGSYDCEAVYEIFNGLWTEHRLGFGRMKHAIQLAGEMSDLTWEAIMEWHLGQDGWGSLIQLNSFAEVLGDLNLEDLLGLLNGETTLRQIRSAYRMAMHFGADFDEALARAQQEGSSPGQLGQFYRLVEKTGMDPTILDGYLAGGASLADIRKAFRLAEGDQALFETILAQGIEAYMAWLKDGRQLSQIAKQYGVEESAVVALYENDCGMNLKCVRDFYHNLAHPSNKGGNGQGNK